MKSEDVKGKTPDELHKMLLDSRKAQMNMRFQRAGGQLEKTHEIRATRRDIARIKTAMTAARKAAGPNTAAKSKAAKPAKTKSAKE